MQLIDSLDAGGAERMAVTFANALSKEIKGSYLCVTRSEGILKDELLREVEFSFIAKKSTLDLRAVFRLRAYLKLHKIDVVHAHTTSYFMATLVKIFYPRIKLIWHTHLGSRVQTSRWKNRILYICSLFFAAIITVNEDLKSWCLQKLIPSQVFYLPNFVSFNAAQERLTREQSIVCLANLKTPKNHLNLIRAFEKIHQQFSEWKLVLVGKNFLDEYSKKLSEVIRVTGLQNKVVFLGQQKEVNSLLCTSSIGVLASDSEGLPMALLEYGAAGLAVVTTKVGQCEQVMAGFGRVVPPNDSEALAHALGSYMKDGEKRLSDAALFSKHIRKNYSVEGVLPQLINIYKKSAY
ncbi:MAG: glycosyltransferase [Bacteroidota bacterium]